MNHPDHPPLRRPSAALLALLLVISPLPLRAGDLNTEVNDMFNNLGAIGNYTAPGAFRGQTFNTYTGGNLMMRSPNKVYQLAAIQFPSAIPCLTSTSVKFTSSAARTSGPIIPCWKLGWISEVSMMPHPRRFPDLTSASNRGCPG